MKRVRVLAAALVALAGGCVLQAQASGSSSRATSLKLRAHDLAFRLR